MPPFTWGPPGEPRLRDRGTYWGRAFEGEVQVARSEIEHLSKELLNLKLALDSAEAIRRVIEQLTIKK